MSDLPSVYFYCADQNTHRDRSRGITRYTYGLLSHLRDTSAVELVAVASKSSFTLPDGIEHFTLPFSSDHMTGRLAADHLHPMFVRRQSPDIWHYPKGFLPAFFPPRGVKIGTVADVMLQFEADHHPHSRSRAAFAYWLWLLRRSIEKFDVVLTVSEFSKHEIERFCDRHRLRCPPIHVTYEGVEVITPAETLPQSKGDYVLHLASHLPYKGTTWLLEQWKSLGETRTDLPHLKLIGTVDAAGAELVRKIDNVTLEPPLPRPQLERTIARARALILPSEVEGFGIPSVEAYLLGTSVAYAKRTALEEIVGFGSPGGFERDRDSLAQAIDEAIALEQLSIKTKAIEMKSRYNWQICVSQTLKAYRLCT